MLVGGESLVNYLTCDSLSSFYGLGVRDFKPLSVSYWFALDLCPRKALVSSYRAYIGLLEIGKIIRSSWRHTFSLKRLTSNFCCDTQCLSTALLSSTDSSPCHSCVLFFIIGAFLPCVICPCFGGIKLCPASWSERWPRVLGNPPLHLCLLWALLQQPLPDPVGPFGELEHALQTCPFWGFLCTSLPPFPISGSLMTLCKCPCLFFPPSGELREGILLPSWLLASHTCITPSASGALISAVHRCEIISALLGTLKADNASFKALWLISKAAFQKP